MLSSSLTKIAAAVSMYVVIFFTHEVRTTPRFTILLYTSKLKSIL